MSNLPELQCHWGGICWIIWRIRTSLSPNPREFAGIAGLNFQVKPRLVSFYETISAKYMCCRKAAPQRLGFLSLPLSLLIRMNFLCGLALSAFWLFLKLCCDSLITYHAETGNGRANFRDFRFLVNASYIFSKGATCIFSMLLKLALDTRLMGFISLNYI